MLDFSWKVFTLTGTIDAYLLLKEMERLNKKKAQRERGNDHRSFNAIH